MPRQKTPATPVPRAMQVQLAKLFGSDSKEARKIARTPAQWRATLLSVLQELTHYVEANVDTDDVHLLMVVSGLSAASESLDEDDFWPGYVEGITRTLLLLLGDYPDHRRRKTGAKGKDHYALDLHRSVQYQQSVAQRFRTLLAAGMVGFPKLSRPPREVLNEFRSTFGSKPTWKQFLEWYRQHYPADYAAVFS